MNIPKKYFRKYQFIIRGIINTLLVKSIFEFDVDISETLVVSGSTRSGSTWLAEIISASPDCAQIFEPISPTHVKEARRIGFGYDTYIKKGVNWPEAEKFMGRILEGKIITPWTTSQIPISKIPKIRNIIVKFVRANLMLDWLIERFPIRPPAVIVRHPCAIVASQQKKGWVPTLESLLKNDFFLDYPGLKQDIMTLNRPEEVLAIRWCMRYYLPLKVLDKSRFVLVIYEDLVRQGVEEIRRLYDRWNIALTEQSINSIARPSKTAVSDSQIFQGKDPLAGWRSKLTQEEIRNIINVTRIFSLDLYSEELSPERSCVNKFR